MFVYRRIRERAHRGETIVDALGSNVLVNATSSLSLMAHSRARAPTTRVRRAENATREYLISRSSLINYHISQRVMRIRFAKPAKKPADPGLSPFRLLLAGDDDPNQSGRPSRPRSPRLHRRAWSCMVYPTRPGATE